MLISHTHKFIFIKNPKTAGTSVEMLFEPYCRSDGPDCLVLHFTECKESKIGVVGYRGYTVAGSKWYAHMSAEVIKQRIGAEVWDSYFKFTTVRNPWDQYVSAFHYKNRDRKISDLPSEFKKYVTETIIPGTRLYSINSKPNMDFYIKYENLVDGVKSVAHKTGVSFKPLKHLKLSLGRGEYRNYYDDGLKELVADRSADVIKLFGYEF
jgi:hypothetical protein